MVTSLFFASTPLHIVLSVAIALTRQDQRNILLCIDQPAGSRNPYLDILANWAKNPFLEQHQLNRHTSFFTKLRVRRSHFDNLRTWVDAYDPAWVFTGSDRRVEFQYAVSRAKARRKVCAVYLDEGTFSYIGRKASRSLGDAYIDNWLKKCSYGWWWKNPATTGASDWIDQCWLFFPALANELLQKKHCQALEQELLSKGVMREFFTNIVRQQGVDVSRLRHITHMLVLPHHSLVQNAAIYVSLVKRLQSQGARVAVKYHPRSQERSYAGMGEARPFYSLTGPLLFEALLALLPEEITLIGDFSSVLLVTKWLRPRISVVAVKEKEGRETDYQSFLQTIGVTISSIETIANNQG